MMKALRALNFRSPLLWLVFLLITFNTYKTASSETQLSSVVRSDGRGYYAYLPAVFIYGNNSWERVLQAEKKYHPENYDQQYLYRTEKGKTFNKYFPGTALFQLPFFLVAWLLAWIFHLPADGYSDVFMVLQFIGNTFYAVIGLLLIHRLYNRLFPGTKTVHEQILALLVLCGPVVYYCFLDQVYSQHISFFLFAAASTFFLDYSKTFNPKKLVLLGIVFGCVFLVRPTNVLFVFFLPVLLNGRQELKALLQSVFGKHLKYFLAAGAGFLLMAFILLLLWKWQTGHWIVWSYSGEGFNFLHPQLWSVLFSFRIGIFLHVPVFLAIVFAVIYFARSESYKLFWWSLYFMVTVWIIAAWWCWDFESRFSVRPLTEHFLFLVLPLFLLAGNFRKMLFIALICFGVPGVIRLVQLETGYMGNQRFTSANYFQSLAFWKEENFARWHFNLSCKPFGRLVESRELLSEAKETAIDSKTEFSLTGTAVLNQENHNGRMYYTVTLDKRFSGGRMEGVFLVIDAVSDDGTKRYYQSTDLFGDAYEGKNDWASLRFEGLIPDYFSEYDKVTIYIWNPGKRKVKVRNYKAVLETYAQ